MLTTEPFFLNPGWAPGLLRHRAGPTRSAGSTQTLPDYAVTPLVALPTIAESLGLARGIRQGRIAEASDCRHSRCSVLHGRFTACSSPNHCARPRLVTAATDGNHGRAVARMAALMKLRATIVVPEGVSERCRRTNPREGADVRVLDMPYDHAPSSTRRHSPKPTRTRCSCRTPRGPATRMSRSGSSTVTRRCSTRPPIRPQHSARVSTWL